MMAETKTLTNFSSHKFVLHEKPESSPFPYLPPGVSGVESSKLIYCDVRDYDANYKEKKEPKNKGAYA